MHNIDGSPNENGSVMEEVHITLRFRCHSERAHLAVANLGQQTVIIGHSWLTLHNPEVDWVSQKVSMTRCPPSCNWCGRPKSHRPSPNAAPPPPFRHDDAGYLIPLHLQPAGLVCTSLTTTPSLDCQA